MRFFFLSVYIIGKYFICTLFSQKGNIDSSYYNLKKFNDLLLKIVCTREHMITYFKYISLNILKMVLSILCIMYIDTKSLPVRI